MSNFWHEPFDDNDLKWLCYSGLAACAIVLTLLLLTYRPAAPVTPAAPRASSTVIISNDEGHGSGVHIGHGFILTAAHVVEGQATMQITDDRGRVQTGAILWANKAYDVALVQVDHAETLATSRLDCTARLAVGDEISAFGNPLNLKFIRTYGKVASDYAAREPWKSSFVASIAVAPGMSGGGVFDRQGDVVGLAVGLAARGSVLGGMAPFAISYVVPSSAVCMLMARA
ncbi:S1 family peptidase [Nitrobacteraceae bacterium UC4446_H13]